ncbi:MAG TPA: LL-diaminopimelate aminotransferase [Actinomycetota bacterium]|nr:LL-diaminopimelate aminotransferase [Actinomycetota bacterium]
MKPARRIETLPPYLFAEIDRKVQAKRAEGVDVIGLGIGDPDKPTPQHIIDAMNEAVADPATHQYPSYFGLPEFRRAVAAWYKRRFDVDLDPDTEVLPLLGSKEGIAHLCTAYIDPGDVSLVPDPAYPVYDIGTRLSGGTPVPFTLSADNGFLPDYDSIQVPKNTKLFWLNYPSNPMASVATLEDFAKAVDFCKANDLLFVHDNAYSEITYDGYVAPSALQAPGAKDCTIEFHSLSKTYNMTGWRIGFVVGNAAAIEALGRVKTNIDSGIFNAIQRAGIAALEGPQDFLKDMIALYKTRRDRVVSTFNDAGWSLEAPKGAVYIWIPVPDGQDSAGFATLLLDEAGVVVPPGRGYGEAGEGYIRISITTPDDRLDEALERIRKVL